MREKFPVAQDAATIPYLIPPLTEGTVVAFQKYVTRFLALLVVFVSKRFRSDSLVKDIDDVMPPNN